MSDFDDDMQMLAANRQQRYAAGRDMRPACSLGVVLRINYADTSDARASCIGELSAQSYGAPTADVFFPSQGATQTHVKIVQHGSARRNGSCWLPCPSTHTVVNGAVYVPEIDALTGAAVVPVRYKEGAGLDDFDGDVVIVESLHIGSGAYDYFIMGTVPHRSPARERLHYAARSRQAQIAQEINSSYTPTDGSASLSVRANRQSLLEYEHPLMGINIDGNVPEYAGSTDDFLLESQTARPPDRLLINHIGEERYVAHNGTVARIDQAGNLLVDTTLAGIKNNGLDIEPAAAFGDAGHLNINLCQRANQGFTLRIGGDVVFSIRHDGVRSVVSLGREIAAAFSSVLGERLEAVFDNHQHMTAQGPTTVPLPVQDSTTASSFPDVPPTGTMRPSNIGSANLSDNHAVLSETVTVRA